MTAEEARALTKKATSPDDAQVLTVVDLWHAAIKKAAEAGRDSVRESELDRIRTPIKPVARRAAIQILCGQGFEVQQVEDGRNEFTWEVSWAAKPIPPQGGSGTAPPRRGPDPRLSPPIPAR